MPIRGKPTYNTDRAQRDEAEWETARYITEWIRMVMGARGVGPATRGQ